MKRIIAVLLSSLMLSAAVMSGCGQSSKPSQAQSSSAEKTTSAPASSQSQNTDTTEAAVSGGWTIDTEIKPVVTESQKAEFEKSINSFDTLNMEPVALLAQQAVQGTNSAFLCLDKTTSGKSVTSWDVAVTYTDLYGKAKLTSIIEVHPENVRTVETPGEGLDDSWQTVEITEGLKLDDSLKEALDSVMTEDYVPVTVLGSQVVSGTNYILIVQEKKDGKPVNMVVELNVDAEGKAELVKEGVFDLNYYLSITS